MKAWRAGRGGAGEPEVAAPRSSPKRQGNRVKEDGNTVLHSVLHLHADLRRGALIVEHQALDRMIWMMRRNEGGRLFEVNHFRERKHVLEVPLISSSP